MKNLINILLCTFILAFSSKAEKHGLVIAIGDYPETSFWPDISSSNDIPHVTSAFKMLGFNSDNIVIISNSAATKSGILQAFKDLEAKAQLGDMIFIHYSGHGQQVVDDNNDEIDGLDEAIVPIDSPLFFEEGVYEGENLIRDDLIGELTLAIRKKIGPTGQLVLVLDSCHSGSGTRGMGKARGTDKIMAPANFKKDNSTSETHLDAVIDDATVAPMVSFFGASSRELNYETLDDQSKPVGSLSFAMASILANAKNSLSFEELFERIKLKMKGLAPNQNPQWEGPKDIYLLGGSTNDKSQLFSVKEVISANEIVAEIGTISGYYEGTSIELFSLDQNKVLTTGEIIQAYLTECDIELDEAINIADDELIKIRILEAVNAPLKCFAKFEFGAESPWLKLQEEMLGANLVTKAENNADLFFSEENGQLKLANKNGDLLFEKAYNEKLQRRTHTKVIQLVKSFTQGKFLRSYNNESPLYDLSLDILAVDCNDISKELGSLNDQAVKVGTCIKLKVTNSGKKAAFFAVLDIQPDNAINLIIPATNLGYTASEYYLEPGDSFVTNYSIEIYEPYGDEVLKLISSDQALDLSGIISSGGSLTRGVAKSHPFEKMLSSSFGGQATRGAKVSQPTVEQVETTNTYFTIVK